MKNEESLKKLSGGMEFEKESLKKTERGDPRQALEDRRWNRHRWWEKNGGAGGATECHAAPQALLRSNCVQMKAKRKDF